MKKLHIINDIKHNKSIIEKKNTSKFIFRNFKKEDEGTTLFVTDLQDLVSKLKNFYRVRTNCHQKEKEESDEESVSDDDTDSILNAVSKKDKRKVHILSEKPLDELLVGILNEENHCLPQISMTDGNLKCIKFTFLGNDYSLECVVTENIPDDNDMSISIAENEFARVKEYDQKIYSWLLNKQNLSSNSKETQQIIDELPNGPMCGYFDQKPRDFVFNCADINKAYTSCLYEMEYFPVFKIFDTYINYNNEHIEDYTNYICELKENGNRAAIISGMKRIFRCYGFILKQLKWLKSIKYTILQYRSPAHLIKSNSKDMIDMLYNSDLLEIFQLLPTIF